MTPVRMLFTISLLGFGAGCSTLQQGTMFRPLSERTASPPVKVADASGDIFTPETESSVARMSHYFPSLPKTVSSATTNTSAGWFHRGPRNEDHLKAMPRPDRRTDDRTATASMTRANTGRPIAQKRPVPDTSRQRDDRLTPATRVESASTPVLPAAVAAETDPADEPPKVKIKVRTLPPLTEAEQALRSARIAQASGSSRSIRRMPQVRQANPVPVEPQAIEAMAAIRSKLPRPTGDEDREMRLVQARIDEPPSNVLAAKELTSERALSLDPPVDNPGPKMVEEPQPSAEPVAIEKPEAVAADLPPPIVIRKPETSPSPTATRDERPIAVKPARRTIDSDSLRDAALTGRPRLTRFAPVRSDKVDDLPQARFPDTYYEKSSKSASMAKLDPETRPARLTWTPQWIRRLRGEDVTRP